MTDHKSIAGNFERDCYSGEIPPLRLRRGGQGVRSYYRTSLKATGHGINSVESRLKSARDGMTAAQCQQKEPIHRVSALKFCLNV